MSTRTGRCPCGSASAVTLPASHRPPGMARMLPRRHQGVRASPRRGRRSVIAGSVLGHHRRQGRGRESPGPHGRMVRAWARTGPISRTEEEEERMPGMTPQDVYELTGVGDPRLSPDGRTVAYVVGRVDKDANEYRGNIWAVPVDGSAPPRQLTFGSRRDAEPRWSPDGSRLAFTSNRAGDSMQLFVIPLAGGEARKLTDVKEDVKQATWSPDGSQIAFAS